jgi:DNA-binding MarR family transcriptional regulator
MRHIRTRRASRGYNVDGVPHNGSAQSLQAGLRGEYCPARSAQGIVSLAFSLQKPDKLPDILGIAAAFQFRLDFHDNDTIRDANPGEGLFMPAKNHDAHTAKFCLASFLPYRLAVVTDSIYRLFGETYQETCNLTIPEWRALAVVAELGTMSPTVIGQRTAMDKVKVSRATQSLVTKGLLRQSQDPRDGRGRLLRLTRKGETTHAKMVPLAAKLEAMLFNDLNRAEVAALSRVLTKISTRLETIAGTGTETGV